MAYTNDELSRIVDQLRVRLDQETVATPPEDLLAPEGPTDEGKFTYTGPGYPRITVVSDGVRRVEFNPDVAYLVKEKSHSHLRSGYITGVYPSVIDVRGGHREIQYAPGNVHRVKSDEMDALVNGIQRIDQFLLRGLDILREDAEMTVRPFSGNAAFYFHPDDMHLPVEQRRVAQGPCTGDPDSGVTGINEGGYENGTQANPYRPWEDPDSPFFGWPVDYP